MSFQTLRFLAARADKMSLLAGTALMAAAIGMTGTLQARTAHAETASGYAQTAAAADAPAAGTASEGFRAHMRERMQERKREFEKEHPPIDKKLTHDQVRDIVAGRLAMSGNPNLKVGKVSTKEDGVIAVEVVTKTGALVDTREISTKTGLPVNAEHHMKARMGHGRFAERGMGKHHGFRDGARGGRDGNKERRDLALTTDQAKKLTEARLILMGNKNLKVGSVKEKDADTIAIDIVASDNSLVMQRLINRHTGRPIRNS